MTTDSIHGERRPSSSQIDEALRQVLRSAQFHGSRQCKDLLKYLVETSLNGHEDLLKERDIGIDVFERKPAYNTAEDPVVRARAGEVRKRLAQYYQSPEARGSAVHIDLPHGSYRPIFIPQPGANGLQEVRTVAPPDLKVSRTVRWRVWGLAAAAACVVLSVAWIGIPRWTKSDLDIFWAPILDGKKPVVIYAGTAPVYLRSMESLNRELSPLTPDEAKQPRQRWTLPLLSEGQVLGAKDVLVDPNGYVEVGDVTTAADLIGLMNGYRRKFDLRVGPDLAFEDLHGAPAVLVGGYANVWTMHLNGDLRFYFDRDLNIRELGGQGRVWSISHGPSRETSSTITEDYAIICRLVDSKTGGPVITLAGTTTCGTRAAGQFVTDPVRMKKLESIIPRSAWERKNLELVLHTTLIDCNPTSVDIVANHSW